jgi:signal transduction histidine kinase
MAMMVESDRPPARSLPEALARTLRHEVGDLLQTVYAAVAILQKRLPSTATVEQRILADLRSRAEGCKGLLDQVSDLVGPLSLSIEQVDLAQLATVLVASAAPRYPKLEIRTAASTPVLVPADEKRISQVGELLLDQACEAACHQVCFRTLVRSAEGEAEWTITDDRPPVPHEELAKLFTPFEGVRHGPSGIRLALAQRLVLVHGGRIAAENTPGGGFCVRVRLPNQAPAPSRS